MFNWNVFGLPLMGPAVATERFFGTLNKVEKELNRRAAKNDPAAVKIQSDREEPRA